MSGKIQQLNNFIEGLELSFQTEGKNIYQTTYTTEKEYSLKFYKATENERNPRRGSFPGE